MKGLNKLVLASTIAAISAGAQAELKALDDSAMGELTGQAGLTIDIETKYTIGEFAYKDGGSVLFQGISMGGGKLSPGGMLDNIRLNLDVAGGGAAGEDLHYGFSEITELAGMLRTRNNNDADIGHLADGNASNITDKADLNEKRNFGDGDLVIHIDATDHLKTGGGMEAFVNDYGRTLGDVKTAQSNTLGLSDLTFDVAKRLVHTAVDFNFSIDAIKLAASDYSMGSGVTGDELFGGTAHESANGNGTLSGGSANASKVTTLISDLNISGFLGPVDISIENNGNGFSVGASVADVQAGQAAQNTFQLAAATAEGTYAVTGDVAAYQSAMLAAQTAYVTTIAGITGVADGVAPVALGGQADSKIHWDTYIDITDLDVYIDIAGVKIENLRIDNKRGDTTNLTDNESFGFAHSMRDIYAVKDAVLSIDADNTGNTNPADYVDGIAINTRFKGDMEIGALSFGDTGTSIGQLFWTDMESTTNLTISAH